ncbi:hypothetical protein [Deinococcus hopiensis]|uniref:hypothetical protein n=1 Tax=Deinococcus hopiensis TaxID=309885 RepID=UPI00111C4588|nr:hypothetical protein [Deinococcus hopiensis]
MSLKAKGLLAVMMSCPEDWQFYMGWLEKQSKDGKEAHQSAVKEPEEHGYVVRQRVNDEKGRLSWEYVVDDEPVEKPEAAMEGKPGHGETRRPVSTTHGRPAPANTESTKTDFTNTGSTKTQTSSASGVFPHALVQDDDHTAVAEPQGDVNIHLTLEGGEGGRLTGLDRRARWGASIPTPHP